MKIDINKIPEKVRYILQKLNENNYEAYAVGGCVRDILLNRIPHDWDIATSALPLEIINLFDNVVETGIKHGTVTVVLDNENFEVTTFRIDGVYSDGRSPESVEFTNNFKDDCSRRDITINSIGIDQFGNIYDCFDGINDLENKAIKCVGNPFDRFNEDYLRILRCIRFSSQLGFDIEKETKSAILKFDNQKILELSKERIRDEINKILLSIKPSIGINLLKEFGLLEIIIPELYNCVSFNQNNPHHDKDVYNHILSVVDNCEPKLELRLAALFHDLGKPICYSEDENEIGHFYGHHKESSRLSRDIMTRYKYSNDEIENVGELVYWHMSRNIPLKSRTVKKFINSVTVDRLQNLFKLQIADEIGGKSPYDFEDIYKIKFECERILDEKQPLSIKDLDINGYDLIAIGYDGKEIGEVLKYLLENVLDEVGINKKEKLLQLAKEGMIKDVKKNHK